MSPGLRDLKLWQEAVALGADVVKAVKRHARRETKVFTDQLLMEAGTVALLVAEGYVRSSSSEQRECYLRGKAALLVLETLVAMARQADLITSVCAAQISTRAQTVSRLLGGYLSHLERQVEAERALPRSNELRGGAAAAPALHEPLQQVNRAKA